MAVAVIPNSNDLSEIFSSILYNISDYGKLLSETAAVYSNTMDEIDKLFFMFLFGLCLREYRRPHKRIVVGKTFGIGLEFF